MPWECVQLGGKWKCVKKGADPSVSDNVRGSHDTKGECEAQKRALYASYEKDK